jgi:glyoxylase-like metal-dependent hydrolase (beta-lactamase superfamily II)
MYVALCRILRDWADGQVTSLITTHHHNDHSGGNEGFVSIFRLFSFLFRSTIYGNERGTQLIK